VDHPHSRIHTLLRDLQGIEVAKNIYKACIFGFLPKSINDAYSKAESHANKHSFVGSEYTWFYNDIDSY